MNHCENACGAGNEKHACIETFSHMSGLDAHSGFSTFLSCISMAAVGRGQRSFQATMASPCEGERKEGRKLPGWHSAEVSFFFFSRGAAGKPLSGHYSLNGQKIGFPQGSEIPLNSFYSAESEWGEIIPGNSIHTCPLIFTSQRGLVWATFHLHSWVLLFCHRKRKEHKKDIILLYHYFLRLDSHWLAWKVNKLLQYY